MRQSCVCFEAIFASADKLRFPAATGQSGSLSESGKLSVAMASGLPSVVVFALCVILAPSVSGELDLS